MAIQDGRACRVIVRHYRKHGTPFWNEVTLSQVKNRAGLVTTYIRLMNDATRRDQAEAAYRLRFVGDGSVAVEVETIVQRDSSIDVRRWMGKDPMDSGRISTPIQSLD